MTWKLSRSIAATLVVAWLGTGCAGKSQPSDFYVLTYAEAPADEAAGTTMREGVSVGVGPIDLPQYLDRSQIVMRSGDNRLELEEFKRWGGRLKDNFTTVLAETLSSELSTDRVSVFPARTPVPVEYQVVVNVTAFETTMDGQSILNARWSVVDARRQNALVMARSSLRQDLAAGSDALDEDVDYDAVAAAMSRNIAALGRDIAAQIKSLPSQ